jgi:membrane protein implicated in regulation of membrane protease activity
MTSADAPDETRGKAGLAVWFGGASLAPWLCCPFWALVCFIALPLALVGLVRACVEYRVSRTGRASRPRAAVGGVLSLLGAAASIAYLTYLSSHPDLPVQG